MGWQSVLIVGEEQLDPSQADIIRLRFPACDIWNLPFTAHEYGYLVAHKDLRAGRSKRAIFHNLREEVQENVNLRKHDPGSPPEHRECYLSEMVKLWDEYHKLP